MDTKSGGARDSKKFDWQGLEAAAISHLVAAVRRARAEYPDEHIYGAMFHEFYGDGAVIYWPCVTVGTEETLAQLLAGWKADGKTIDADLEHSLRWSGADLEMVPGGAGARSSEAGDVENAWAERCQAAASAPGGFEAWEKVYDRFLRVFPRAAKKARAQLVDEGVVGKEFIAIAADEGGDLIPLSLTKAQLLRHFPEYDLTGQERARLAALPLAERVAELVPQAVYDFNNPAVKRGVLGDEYEGLVRELGEAAVPALVDVVVGRARGSVPSACWLLADINYSTPEVIAALEQAMTEIRGDTYPIGDPVRCWAARALARLGHMDLLVRHKLPVDVVASGLADPYTGFRDNGKHRPLDYAPLEAILREHPELADAVAEKLKPVCKIDASEVDAARAGLESSWPFIRKHAQLVLEWWEECRA